MSAPAKRKITDLSDEEIRKEVDSNHIWLNAFATIRPTDAFLQGLGQEVLSMLRSSDLVDGLGLSPTVIIRINAS